MTQATPSGSRSTRDEPGWNAIGVGTFSGAIHRSSWAIVWSMSPTMNPISVAHASKAGFPKSAASARSTASSWAITSSRTRRSVSTRQPRGRVRPEANAWRAPSTIVVMSASGVREGAAGGAGAAEEVLMTSRYVPSRRRGRSRPGRRVSSTTVDIGHCRRSLSPVAVTGRPSDRQASAISWVIERWRGSKPRLR